MTGLRIAKGFELPLDAITETFAVLAKRGAGKTYASSVLVEEVVKAGHPAVIIDPLGVWWGLRSSADGKRDGLPVAVFGGDHGDLPLAETQGRVLAEAIVEGRFPAILDLSLLSKSAMRRFVADFLEALYHRNRDPLLVVADEADLWAPQRTTPDSTRLLGAMEDLVRRGRARGLGCVMITQRPAVLNKDVLSQASVLVALRMGGTHDVAAIDEWIRLHADESEARELKASLPSLPVGTAWIWSPGWLGVLRKVQVRRRETFDSSATPKVGEARIVPTKLADIDLPALGARLEEAREEAERNDPAALRRRLAAAERRMAELEQRPQVPAAIERVEVPVEVRVEVPVLTAEHLELLQTVTRLLDASQVALDQARPELERLTRAVENIQAAPQAVTKPAAPIITSHRGRLRDAAQQVREAKADLAAAAVPPAPRPAGTSTTSDTAALPKAQRAILSALAVHGTRTTVQVALLTGYSSKSGGFRNALSSLRTAGFIEGRGDITATPAGLDALGDFEPLPTGMALVEWWKDNHLGRAERAILDVLVGAYPNPVPITEIAERTEYSASSGGFRNALSRLRTFQLASGRGELVLDDMLDPNG